MKWSVGSKIAAGFGLALVIFVAVGYTSWRSTARLIEASELRRSTDERDDALTDARLAMRGVGVALRTYLISGEDPHLEQLRQAEKSLADPIQNLRRLMNDSPVQAARVEGLNNMVQEYLRAINAIAELRRTQGYAPAAQKFLADETRQLLAETGRQISTLQQEQEVLSRERTEASDREVEITQTTVLWGNLVALVVALAAGFLITRNISLPLARLTADAERITGGDLASPAPMDHRSDEIGVLSRALARMTDSLRRMAQTAEQIATGDLRAKVEPQSAQDILGNAFARMLADLRAQITELIDGASVLGAAASEIVASSSQLAATATQSAAAVSETTTTVEEVRQTAQLTSQKARLVSESAQKSVQTADSGRRSTQDVDAGMARIRRQMEAIATSMVQLAEQSQAVSQIIATVEDLSTQSNLLAVNAAIEAAKAGEQGKGFGVVAQEVKSLAEQSRAATTQVREILRDIQRATHAAVLAGEEGNKVVDAGARQTEVAAGSIQALGASVNDAAQAALQIAASSQQQLVGMDQVAGAMESIHQASAQNVASAQQLEATARGIQHLGERIKSMVDRYKV